MKTNVKSTIDMLIDDELGRILRKEFHIDTHMYGYYYFQFGYVYVSVNYLSPTGEIIIAHSSGDKSLLRSVDINNPNCFELVVECVREASKIRSENDDRTRTDYSSSGFT